MFLRAVTSCYSNEEYTGFLTLFGNSLCQLELCVPQTTLFKCPIYNCVRMSFLSAQICSINSMFCFVSSISDFCNGIFFSVIACCHTSNIFPSLTGFQVMYLLMFFNVSHTDYNNKCFYIFIFYGIFVPTQFSPYIFTVFVHGLVFLVQRIHNSSWPTSL